MKKKIYSLIMGICLFFAGVFSFSGCSLVSGSSEKKGEAIVMKIGDTSVTKNDLINAFYTYYQNNSSYFAYYDEATIEESFYTWFTVKTMVEELSFKELYDATKNPKGKIYYTNKDAEEVWKNVEDYFYSQINTYEKALYAADGVEEDDYPSWLHDHKHDEETASEFSHYKSPLKDIEITDRKSDVAKKLSSKEVYDRVADLKVRLFKYVEEEDHDGTETLADIVDEPFKVRNQAYANYIQALVSNAKANGVSTKIDDVLKAEVLRIYNAYYDSQIGVIFQNYFVQDQLLNYNNAGDKYTLSDKSVVAKFLDAYYKDKQTYRLQDGYVEKMESQDGASLMLYHYQGRNYYFSVQHILVQFTDYVMEQVQNLEGYGVTNAGKSVYEKYISDRKAIADANAKALLTEVNKDAEKGTLVSAGSYYYYDESKKETYIDTVDEKIYNGYVLLASTKFDSATNKYVVDTTTAKTYTNSEGKEITWESDEAKLMASVQDVLNSYEKTLALWKSKVDELFADDQTTIDDVIGKDVEDGRYEELEYVLEVVQNMKELGATDTEIDSKLSSLAFIELEWLYSGDSLGNEMSNKIGYIVSSQDDNNMNWVVDFAVGARAMLANYKTKTAEQRISYTETVMTDYGYHIMKIENVYDEDHASIINLESISEDYDLEDAEYVEKVVKLMRKTYVCASSNETIYDHYYDELYNTLVGTSSSSGTYFLNLEYQWLAEYYSDNKIEVIEQVDYHELIDSIS